MEGFLPQKDYMALTTGYWRGYINTYMDIHKQQEHGGALTTKTCSGSNNKNM
jgi:hypothetical protein